MTDQPDMPRESMDGVRLRLTQSSIGGTNVPVSTKRAGKSLANYSLLLAPGVLAGMVVYVIYPPLDQGFLMTFGLCALFLPMILQLRSIMRKRLAEDVPMLRKTYVCSGLALELLAGVLLLNGKLDKSPRTLEKTTLLQKRLSRGRRGTSLLCPPGAPGSGQRIFTSIPSCLRGP